MNTSPDERRLENMRAVFTHDLKPVRPLPSNALMASVALIGFLVFCVLAAWPAGLYGFNTFSFAEKVVYYTVVLAFAVLFSVASVEHMIPGAKRHFRVSVLVVGALLGVLLLAIFLFPNHSLENFARIGYPCLRLGLISAAIGGALGFWASRKGLFTSPLASAVLLASFSGFAGVGVLALHCPVQNWAHIVVWHLGAIPIAGAVGWLLGMRVSGGD
jgi:hypothetical protein